MILLSVSDSLQVANSTTDWMQGWGAIIASIGAVAGFILLIKDSKEKQSQINVLTDLAEEAKEQTIHLASQVDQMIEGNKLLANHVNLIQKTVSFNEKSLIMEQERNDLDKQQRKNRIKPIFKIIQYNSDNSCITLDFQVEGGSAKFVRVEGSKIENMQYIAECNYPNDLIPINYFLQIRILNNSSILIEMSRFILNLELFYMDIQGNKYSQKYDGVFNELQFHEPVEINEL